MALGSKRRGGQARISFAIERTKGTAGYMAKQVQEAWSNLAFALQKEAMQAGGRVSLRPYNISWARYLPPFNLLQVINASILSPISSCT